MIAENYTFLVVNSLSYDVDIFIYEYQVYHVTE